MQNNLYNTIYNPDVLSCIANLSNDEVFTPPNIANNMLDMLPQELFSDPNATFLDPACKSGVFLREIAKRLLKGLEKKIPDLQERTNHIFKKQLFGIPVRTSTYVDYRGEVVLETRVERSELPELTARLESRLRRPLRRVS